MVVTICLLSGSPLVCLLGLLLATLEVTVLAGIPLSAFWYFVRLPIGFIAIGVLTIAFTGVPAGGGPCWPSRWGRGGWGSPRPA